MSASARSAARGMRRLFIPPLHGHVPSRQPTVAATQSYGGCVSCCSATAARRPRHMITSVIDSEWRGADNRQLSRGRRPHLPVRARGIASYSDPYATLGVQRGAPQAEVDKAYRKLAMKWHPDRNQDNKEAAERQFKLISEAYQSISSGGASSPFGAGAGGGSTGGFPGGFPGGSHVHMDPQMAAFMREMFSGAQMSEQQLRQMMAEAARRQGNTRQSSGPGFQSVRYEFSFGGRPKAREPTQAEKEAMEVSRSIDPTDRLCPRDACFLCYSPFQFDQSS